MYPKLICLLLLVFYFFNGTAQQISVQIKITNQETLPIAFASIRVVNRTDSTQFFTQTTDSSGIARFQLVINNQYIVSTSSINYATLEKGILVREAEAWFVFQLANEGKTLESVIVKSTRPLMRQEDDKTIVDPETLVEMSTNSYEVIEKTPGLFVDQDGNIYISSMTPATVQINGRDMKMSAADMATLLKTLPPNAIASIEIVRTPSAKYDANSSGGVVNVVLKKGVKLGMTGSISAGFQQGRLGNQFASFNLNNNKDNKAYSLHLSYNRRNGYERLTTNRILSTDTLLYQNAYTKYPGQGLSASFSYQFPWKAKWEFDINNGLNYNINNSSATNTNTIKKNSTGEIISNSLNLTGNDGSSLNYRLSLRGKLKIDSSGSYWETDVFYNYTTNNNEQAFSNKLNYPLSFSTAGDGINDNQRNFFHLQSDLTLKLKKRFTLETGVKVSLLNFKSDAPYYKEESGNRVKDTKRTNRFFYNENLNAAYAQLSKTLGKDLVIKAGLRMENTRMKGRQVLPDDTTFSIDRTDLFPYIYLSKGLSKIAGYEMRAYLVYRRTIARPSYEQLNPFSRYVDEFLSEAGNPTLRPQFNTNYEANISVNERPIFALGINETKDIFTNVIYQPDTANSIALRTLDNLGKNKEWYFKGLGAIPPGGRYFFVAGAQYNHNFYQGLYENKPLAFKKGTWTFFTYHTYKIDHLSTITLNGFMRLKGQQQFYELSSFGGLYVSINRKVWKQKLVVALSVSDIFFTNNNHFTLQQGSVNASGYRQSDTRRVGFNLRYSFGIRKKEDSDNNMFNVPTN